MTETTGEHGWTVALRSAGADTLELSVYDVIGGGMFGDGVMAKGMLSQLRAAPKASKISLRVNSVGGIVDEAKAMVNLLAERAANGVTIEATVDGLAASAASYLLTAASKVVMPENAFMMLHGVRGGVRGTAEDMESAASLMRRTNEHLALAYANASQRRGVDKSKEDYIKQFAKGDLYLDADEAIAWGLADEKLEAVKVAACLVDIGSLADAPEALRAAPYVTHATQAQLVASAVTEAVETVLAHAEFAPAIELPATPAEAPIAATLPVSGKGKHMPEDIVQQPVAVAEPVVVAMSGVKLLGVATEVEATAKIKELQNSALQVLGITGKASTAEAMAVLLDWKQRADQHSAMTQQVATLTEESRTAKRDAAIEKVSREGYLPPARHDWARTQFATADAVESFCAGMPKGFFSAVTEQGEGTSASAVLTADEKHICKLTGVTEQAFLEQKKLDQQARSARVGG